MGGQSFVYATETAYDSLGNEVWIQDAEGHATEHVYDSLGRKVETREPAREVLLPDATTPVTISPTTRYVHDAVGNVVAVRRANGIASGDVASYTTNITYDALDRVIRIEGPVSLDTTAPVAGTGIRVTTRYYDDAGNLTRGSSEFALWAIQASPARQRER